MGPMLRAVGLSKSYLTPAGTVTALADVDVAFQPGKLTTIVGPSGSGKSTLLNLLAGFDKPTAGEVYLGDKLLSDLDESEISRLRLHRFGFVFQSYNLVAVLNAWQNVALPLGLAGQTAARRKATATAMLERFGLAARATHLPSKLSGGERQRVSLARALVNDPEVVFADEPTGNLDSRSGRTVLQALRDVAAEGRTVIVVTHDLGIAERADAVLELLDGRVTGAHGAIAAAVAGQRPEKVDEHVN